MQSNGEVELTVMLTAAGGGVVSLESPQTRFVRTSNKRLRREIYLS
jgi:hypothetical protein